MPRLTETEQQEVIRFLEADKPLPDTYRFLLFADKREVELVWNGKTNEVTNAVLPFQVIEQIDEPRAESLKADAPLFAWAGVSLDSRGRQLKGWSNKLIWGDNKLILASLKNGPLREEIEAQGGIKLIYIDPPFDVGADFSMDIEIGDDTFTKKPGILEEIAYRDTWGKGADSFIAMIYERLILMRDLLAEDGSIYVHCDWRVNSYVRLVLDEIFGKNNLINQVVWSYRTGGMPEGTSFGKKHDNLMYYAKTENFVFNTQKQKSYLDTKFFKPHQKSQRSLVLKKDYIGMYRWVDCRDVWDDLKAMHPRSDERVGYPTQKPEALIERIVKVSSNEGKDLWLISSVALAPPPPSLREAGPASGSSPTWVNSPSTHHAASASSACSANQQPGKTTAPSKSSTWANTNASTTSASTPTCVKKSSISS